VAAGGVAAGTAPFLADEVRALLCVASIGSLVRHIPPQLIATLVRDGTWSPHQGLAHARQIPDGLGLAALAGQLPEPLAGEAYTEAVVVAARLTDVERRACALSALVARLPREARVDALRQAVSAVRELTDQQRVAGGYGNNYRSGEGERYVHTGRRTAALTEAAETLARLAPPTTPPDPGEQEHRVAALVDRLRAAREIDDDAERDTEAAAIAGTLGDPPAVSDPPGEGNGRPVVLVDAIAAPAVLPLDDAITRPRIGDDAERAGVELGLRTPPPRPEPVPDPTPPQTGPWRPPVRRVATIERDRPIPDLREAFQAAYQLADEYARDSALATLAPQLPEPLAIEVYQAIRDLTYHEYGEVREGPSAYVALAMLGLAPRLPVPLRDEALARVLPAAHRWTYGEAQFEEPHSFLFKTLDYAGDLPDSPMASELRHAISTSAIRAARAATYGRGHRGWNAGYRVMALLSLLSYLVEPHLSEATRTLLDLLLEEYADPLEPHQAAALARYLPGEFLATTERVITKVPLPAYLPEQLLPDALKVARQRRNVAWLHATAARLTGPPLLDALDAAQDIGGPALRAELLGRRATAYAALPPALSHAAWADTLHSLAGLDRPAVLDALAKLGPLVTALGGPNAIDDVLGAVADVAAWWP
jgi:hypothetical protein